MKSTLLGPLDLTFDQVEQALPIGKGGVFALGHVDTVGTFRVQRVGRDDHDLGRSLQRLIGSSTRFKYAVVASPQLAFEYECELFHRFRPPGNVIHPTRPACSQWKCPVCIQFHV